MLIPAAKGIGLAIDYLNKLEGLGKLFTERACLKKNLVYFEIIQNLCRHWWRIDFRSNFLLKIKQALTYLAVFILGIKKVKNEN
jgi:hypothetical protein